MGCACTKQTGVLHVPPLRGKLSLFSLGRCTETAEADRPQAHPEGKGKRTHVQQQYFPWDSHAGPLSISKRPNHRDPLNDVPGNLPKQIEGEQVAAGWPAWLSAVAGESIKGWIPRKADSFEKLDKIGQGTYSNVYKARDLVTEKIVAMKKVRFDNLEEESIRFMAREILVLRRLDHPNVVKLEGLVTSRISCSLYLVFEYMEHDLAGLAACPDIDFTEAQVKCYLSQLLSGLDHCHSRHVLHRDIKGSNLLLDNSGILKIADFGLATFFNPYEKQILTSRVVTLWYRPPELLLGVTDYGVSVDLWSTGCILAELLAGKPILTGRTEVFFFFIWVHILHSCQLHPLSELRICTRFGVKVWSYISCYMQEIHFIDHKYIVMTRQDCLKKSVNKGLCITQCIRCTCCLLVSNSVSLLQIVRCRACDSVYSGF
ncbi:hypothetical protein KP509_19G016000 [Ceratopteris richardii]|uniref:Protein kinase domain-containing protein n=1 Tax=Ceratopteris richardii TaxID=49495 RepID=A0A8T2SK23_CERRI|nr:hypothetical protein KP509_19G016000 [Ceratopteris richardii]